MVLVVAGTAAVYAHYLAVGVLAITALVGLTRWAGPRRPSRGAWLSPYAVALLLSAPWLIASGVAFVRADAVRTSLDGPASIPALVGALIEATAGHVALLQGATIIELAGLAIGIVLLAAGWRAGAGPRMRGLRMLLVASLAVVLLPALAGAVTGRWLFAAPFVTLVLPSLLVVASAGVVHLARSRLAPAFARDMPTDVPVGVPCPPGLVVAWLVVASVGLGLDRSGRWHTDDEYREIGAVLEERRQDGEALVVTPPILVPGASHYHPGAVEGLPLGFDPMHVYLPSEPDAWADSMGAAVERVAESRAALWLLYRPDMDPNAALLRGLRARFPVEEHWPYDVVDLYRFDRGEP